MVTEISPIVRFAPSPTGRLHIGNIRTALFNWLFAAKNGGTFVLRLDDTDVERSTEEFALGICDDLSWLGIDPHRTEKQSSRVSLYDAAADKLRSSGQLYACYETPDEIDRRRKRLMARGLPPIYDRTALELTSEEKERLEAEGRRPHWRFLLPNFEETPFKTTRTEVRWQDVIRGEQTVDLASMSDPVLVREDGSYLYTLPSVVDDLDMQISHVIRGGDHITNTGAQIALFEALSGAVPAFGHHNLLTDASGDGLSKRKGALSIASLRDDGLEPMAIASLATLIGTGQAVEACVDMQMLSRVFEPDKVSKSAAKFDAAELESLNQKLLHNMSYETAKPRLATIECDEGEAFWQAVRPNLAQFNDVMNWKRVLDGEFSKASFDEEELAYIKRAIELVPAQPWGENTWGEWTGALKSETGRKGKDLFMPLRKVLTGLDHGPDMKQFLPVIGWERTLRRLS